MILWAVYKNPKDYPDEYIAREWRLDANGNPVASVDEMIRNARLEPIQKELLCKGLYPYPPFPDDDPVIVECWF